MTIFSKKHFFLLASLTLAASACLPSASDETDEVSASGAQDDFTEDKAGPAFGVEADAPDALAVLHIANTFSKAKLIAAGVTTRVAKNIVKARTANGEFTTLEALDKVPYVGLKVFSALRWHATIKRLYPTSVRIATVDTYGEAIPKLANEALVNAGLVPIPDHVWVNSEHPYGVTLSDWEADFHDAGLEFDEIEPFYLGTLAELDALAEQAHASPACWIGNPWQIADLLAGERDGLLADEYSIWGWRVGDKQVHDPELPLQQLEEEPAWGEYDTNSNDVLVLFTDAGDNYQFDYLPACR